MDNDCGEVHENFNLKTENFDTDDNTDDSDNVVEEGDENDEPTTCLFCNNVSSNIEDAIKHVDCVHNVNLLELKRKYGMDQYSFIKLINFIRHENVNAEKLQNTQAAIWLNDKYLKPKAYEPWLSYDYENIEMSQLNTMEDGDCPAKDNLKDEVLSLKEQIQIQKDQLEQAAHNMTIMRNAFQRLLDKQDSQNDLQCNSKNALITQDQSYFDNYNHFSIHHEMLADTVRTLSYKDAFFKNRQFIQGKDVLDVGCGTGILSMFASQAGASKVIGIDNSTIIHHAVDIVQKNNIKNVTLIKGRLEDTPLPQEKYDIVVSEWMGYFLLFEGMLDSIIYARDNHLKSDGILLPNRCTLNLLGYGDDNLYTQHITYWNNVYGLDMSTMCKEVMREPLIDIINPSDILTEAICIANFDLYKLDANYSNFECNLELLCIRDGNLSSFVGYFDVYFDLPENVMFSTSPKCTPTHWKQVIFFLQQAHSVKKGDVITGHIQCKRSLKCSRSLTIDLEIFGQSFTYHLD